MAGVTITRVFAISETFYDILFNKGKPVSACPGGAMLNSSISLGRANVPVSFISEFAHDNVGNIIYEFLRENNVSTEHLYLYEGSSPLSLAFLNDRNDATYDFYEDFPQERFMTSIPSFGPGDIVMFGSILAVTKEVRTRLEELINSAKNASSTILYDPNFRPSQLPLLEEIKPMISENIAYSDIVRASDEDMRMIHGCMNSDEAYDFIKMNGCKFLIYTSSSNGVYLKTPSFSKYYKVPVIETVSTVGAGDSFNAGIVYMLHSRKIRDIGCVSEQMWDEIIAKATDFASRVCMSTENYISNDFAISLKKI
ncbi:PfkB family carbohydrate kinase [Methanolobus mangrovi]|uniref:PfkB family carbohydrate kinase n=1 Tax=Methanolobus mangrovi TaxID=3072977 RepID=A0AA51UF25_9EURY|nr:PfkB family carbohydrate kinase [Methanolobus mangrovi]WMW21955.1 PfkB family carbohydrate kinase [Methanolobus mangrovi]